MAETLRARFARKPIVVAPGVYDAFSGLIATQAGFETLYVSGAAIAYTRLGRPDIGLVSMSEVAQTVTLIRDRVGAHLVVDADTGYGNAINVVRTVQLYEQAGVAGIQLEDQVMPKKCGHMSGKLLIGADEMAGKVRAAAAARRDPDLLIIARTDAVAVTGVDDAIARARTFAEAGADALFVEAPTSEDDIERVATELRDVAPLVFNWAEGGRTPPLSLERIAELGFSLVIYPIGALLAATAGIRALMATLKADGTPVAAMPGLPSFGEFTDLIGLPEIQELEQRFSGG